MIDIQASTAVHPIGPASAGAAAPKRLPEIDLSDALRFDTGHTQMIHDGQLDYYGQRLATCSSDRRIMIWQVADKQQPAKLLKVIDEHTAPVWQVAWAHPKFGSILASCSHDKTVRIFKEIDGDWHNIKTHIFAESVSAIAWAPHELGPILACGVANGTAAVMTFTESGYWDVQTIDAHTAGCNTVAWMPSISYGAASTEQGSAPASLPMHFATGGCDNFVKIWNWNESNKEWVLEATLDRHTNWVRDVAFAPDFGFPKQYLATCGQDRQVYIWSKDAGSNQKEWNPKPLKGEAFKDVVWRLSWSPSGNVLAVSSGDGTVSLWKESLAGEWEEIAEIENDHAEGIVG
ncbi:WD40 repeat-like protein [Ramicandelaber brevisporus]|nr:WD40 repeat-like protein [Ramicandelaber brevisporus]